MKTSELTGAQLDYWVAKAECLLGPTQRHFFKTYAIHEGACRAHSDASAWRPSADWAVGGPIIDRERIQIRPVLRLEGHPDGWRAQIGPRAFDFFGSAALVAAMRAYVASKFGDDVADTPQ